MFELPSFLTHYYEGSERPFISLSDLDDASLEREFAELAPLPLKLHRFKTLEAAHHYMKLRRAAEAKVRQRFIDKGGKPVLRNPRYMVLGTSKWFEDWYVEKREIRIPLDHFADVQIGFTYPDAVISTILAENPRWEPFRKPYHGVVFTKSEIGDVIAQYGMPDEDDPARLQIEEHLIEAQIWDMAPLQAFLSTLDERTV